MKRKKMGPERRRDAYHRWLAGTTWKSIKLKAAAVHGSACIACGHQPVQWHHIFYPPSWDHTEPKHLMPLCRFHHREVSAMEGGGITDDESDLDRFRKELEQALTAIDPLECEPMLITDMFELPGYMYLGAGVLWEWEHTGRKEWLKVAFGLPGDGPDWYKHAVGRRILYDRWWGALHTLSPNADRSHLPPGYIEAQDAAMSVPPVMPDDGVFTEAAILKRGLAKFLASTPTSPLTPCPPPERTPA